MDAGGVRLQVLGGLALEVAEFRVSEDDLSAKAAALLKVLALAEGHTLPRYQAIDILWPDADTDSGLNRLYKGLHELRIALAPTTTGSIVVLRRQTLRLAETIDVDIDEFAAAAEHARVTNQIEAFETALRRYPQDLLPSDIYVDWTTNPRDRLRAIAQELRLALAELYLVRDRSIEAERLLAAAVEVDPCEERAHVELMRVYAARGGRARVLRQYEQCRTALREAFAVSPSPRTETVLRTLIADVNEVSATSSRYSTGSWSPTRAVGLLPLRQSPEQNACAL